MKSDKKIVIIGGGLSGVSLSFFLKMNGVNSELFEKENELGGLCRSIKQDGFIFDFSGHLLHFRNKSVFRLVSSLLKGNLVKHKRSSWVYTLNTFVPCPFQTGFYALPEAPAKECFSGLVESFDGPERPVSARNFLEWVNTNFGNGIAKYFMLPYNRKLWQIPLRSLSSEWAGRFIVVPDRKDISGKFTGVNPGNPGYNACFWYPGRGGINELIKAFSSAGGRTETGCRVSEIDLKSRTVSFPGGKKKYGKLAVTVPLPELAAIVKGLPADIKSEFRKLRWVSIYNLNLGLDKPVMPGRHWVYFPDKDPVFFRAGFFHNFSQTTVPAGRGALYAEAAYLPDKPVRGSLIRDKIKNGLSKSGILDKKRAIICETSVNMKYGYPIYDHAYALTRKRILGFFEGQGVFCSGRYGGWQYSSMEDVISESMGLAERLLV